MPAGWLIRRYRFEDIAQAVVGVLRGSAIKPVLTF
jgi:hypothetical protein